MDYAIELALVAIIPLLLSLFAYHKSLMTRNAAILAYALSIVIGICSNIWWVLAFFTFPIVAFIATKWRLKEKIALGLQEGKKGERHVMNILGVGIIPTAVALAYFITGGDSTCLAAAFLSALAVSTADTVASETGIWARKTYMITTFKEIEPGPNGGVSVYGTVTSAIGAVLFAFISWGFVFHGYSLDTSSFKFLIVAAAGMAGNILDSILGATLENPGYIGKYFNNASTSLFGAVVGFLLCMLI